MRVGIFNFNNFIRLKAQNKLFLYVDIVYVIRTLLQYNLDRHIQNNRFNI